MINVVTTVHMEASTQDERNKIKKVDVIKNSCLDEMCARLERKTSTTKSDA